MEYLLPFGQAVRSSLACNDLTDNMRPDQTVFSNGFFRKKMYKSINILSLTFRLNRGSWAELYL